jgi:hypothetical protein
VAQPARMARAHGAAKVIAHRRRLMVCLMLRFSYGWLIAR